MSYGYDANSVFLNTFKDIKGAAKDLLNHIDSARTTTEQKAAPIIFIAHSLGGLVVKSVSRMACTPHVSYTNIYQALNQAWAKKNTIKISSTEPQDVSFSPFRTAMPIWPAGLTILASS
jgi:predicted alpha/beta hydrolase family esterase